MTKEFLERCLAQGMSLERIGALTGRHPSIISYHLKKHGLRASNHFANAPKGSRIRRERLESLLAEGASPSEIASELDLSVSTVRYWLKKYSLRPTRIGRERARAAAARKQGQQRIEMTCARHGPSTFVLESRGYYRCLRCRSAAVSEHRRRTKRDLVDAAGGCCAICGYDRYQGALQFHHLEPAKKEFVISRGATRALAETRAEATKCIVLCANCHAEVEAGIDSTP